MSCLIGFFRDPRTWWWGWRCFSCGMELAVFGSLAEAEDAADIHEQIVRSLGVTT